ncbi:uncharacterized protein LOC128992413 [Macrosteles quadrilineatus]|uniref:uncharacterized protein LOC128992413 n=1 Tax=Macrosteles quadrilineatus TaxID=74068 RepID=UPI0023E10689|nr:uncharacterized protein LOC128992413 [Macrosteles quadrilineatus]
MVCRSVYILLCILPTLLVSQEDQLPTTDYILCRDCGNDLAAADTIVNLRSPSAVSRFNKSLFGLQQVLVQELVYPPILKFKVITVVESTCNTSSKDWAVEHSWFPGYAWKPCTCSQCKKLVGWVFEPLASADKSKVKASDKGFYTLLLEGVVSEFFSNGLMLVPQTLSTREKLFTR